MKIKKWVLKGLKMEMNTFRMKKMRMEVGDYIISG